MRKRIVEGAPAAHRLGDDPDIARAEVIDQRGEIARIVGRIGPTRRRSRWRKAAVGKRHAGVAIAEMRHLLPPAQVIAAEPVGKDQKRAGAADLVVKAAAGAVEIAALHPSSLFPSGHLDNIRTDHRASVPYGFLLNVSGKSEYPFCKKD